MPCCAVSLASALWQFYIEGCGGQTGFNSGTQTNQNTENSWLVVDNENEKKVDKKKAKHEKSNCKDTKLNKRKTKNAQLHKQQQQQKFVILKIIQPERDWTTTANLLLLQTYRWLPTMWAALGSIWGLSNKRIANFFVKTFPAARSKVALDSCPDAARRSAWIQRKSKKIKK